MPKPLANTALLPLLLLLPVLALFGSCLALETRPTYIDTGTSTGPEPSWGVCDESNSSYYYDSGYYYDSCDNCLECSRDSKECRVAYNRCANSQDCIDFSQCISDCLDFTSGQAQNECFDECIDWYPSGEALFWGYNLCVYCACPTACGQYEECQ